MRLLLGERGEAQRDEAEKQGSAQGRSLREGRPAV
jgi:hypothetical protein